MSSDGHDFTESLGMGLRWEDELADRLEEVLLTTGLESISFEEDPGMQRRGIDIVLQQENPNIDVKSRKNYVLQWGDILLETWSVYEKEIDGWAKKPDIDLVAYVVENESRTNLVRGHFIVMNDEFRDWFEGNIEEDVTDYPLKTADNDSFGGYTTHNRAVPIEDFPPGTLVEFDPTLHEPVKDEQQELSRWSE